MERIKPEESENPRSFAGEIKWRQHEMILVTAATLIMIAGQLWTGLHTDQSQFSNPFISHHVPFNLYKNVIGPGIGLLLAIYLAYLWFSLYTIPHLQFFNKNEAGVSNTPRRSSKRSSSEIKRVPAKKYGWLFVQVILVIFFLGVVFNIATYFRQQWQFSYPGFSIFFDENNPRSQLGLSGKFVAAAFIVLAYGLYVFLREAIIALITLSAHREFHIMVCNKVTAFILQFVCIPVFLQSFNIVDDRQFFVVYFLVVPALFAMFISNVYWLFPMKGSGSFFSARMMTRLLSTSFVYGAPLIVFVHEAIPVAFLFSWAVQLFIMTPITWWYYQINKEKIEQLRKVENALAKSKTDLQFLRSQINPHFLFNTLNTLYGTALQEHAPRSAEGIQRLGDMMRFMLHENNLDFIGMDREVEYLKNYIALQKLRTQSCPGIVIEDNIIDQNCNHRIAPMLLIPLVENAFKHGISLRERSWIRINLQCTGKDIRFEVCNSVHTKNENDPENEGSGVGFTNVLERLKLLYPGKFQIAVDKSDREYFVKLFIEPSFEN